MRKTSTKFPDDVASPLSVFFRSLLEDIKVQWFNRTKLKNSVLTVPLIEPKIVTSRSPEMWPGSARSKLTYKNETKNETQFTKYALLFKNKIFRNNHENQQSLPLCSLLVPFFPSHSGAFAVSSQFQQFDNLNTSPRRQKHN